MMIGRETVVSEVSEKLRNERFVTLLGPGGIGKTTIALAVGRAVAEEFGGEVHFVDLESLTDPRHVAGAVATSLGLALTSKDPGLELVDLVCSRKFLIILDNCEHVIEAVALLAEQLYQESEQIYLLTTSRELLKVGGEHCWRVLPLDFPPDGSEQTANAVLRYPAVQLLARRVAARAGSFILTDEEAPFVAEMCRKLDGIPLAIELAAGQVAALGFKNTVARLELLKLAHRSAVARHQTLKATLDWSYNLLSDGERIVLRRIAPFVGQFTLEGARYVAGELGIGTGEIFDAIAGLVEKSLIATRIDETQAQYRLLDTTRAYALEKLEEHAEVDVVVRRHAEYVAGYLEPQRVALLECAEADKSSHVPPRGETLAPLGWCGCVAAAGENWQPTRWRFPVGASRTRQTLQPEATDRHDAEFGQVSAQGIAQHGALALAIAGPARHQGGLLLLRLDRDEPHRRPRHRLTVAAASFASSLPRLR
jgi:predicted ATPase